MSLSTRTKGAIYLAAFVALTALVVARPSNPFTTMRVSAQFDDAPQFTGAVDRDVRMNGVNVGQVGKLELAPGSDDAIVELKLEKGMVGKISADASAEVRPHTAFEGSSFVELDPGSPSAPPLGDRVIPPSRTRNFVSIDEVLRVARPHVRKAIKDDVRDLDYSLGGRAPESIQRTLRNLPPAFTDGAPAGRALRGVRGNELRGAIRGLAATTAVLARREDDLAPLLSNGARTLSAVDVDSGAALDDTLIEAPPTLRRLVGGGRDLERIVDALEPLAVNLRPALAEAAPALREARPLLRELRPVARQAPPLVDDLRVALDRGADATPPTQLLLQNVQRALVKLDDPILPILHESTREAAKVGRRRVKAPPGLAPAVDVPLYKLVARGAGESGSGSLAAIVRPEQSRRSPGNFGSGHAFRFGAFPAGRPEQVPPCSKVPAELRDQAVSRDLCKGTTP